MARDQVIWRGGMIDYEQHLGALMEDMTIEEVIAGRMPDLALVRQEGAGEGYTFVERAAIEWLTGTNRFDGHGEGFFVAHRGEAIVGMCGLNRDPYSGDEGVGRLRHLYVVPEARRQGVGRELVESCPGLAQARFDWTRRIDNDLIRPLLVICASGVRDELKEAVHRVMIRTVMIRNHRRCR